MMVYEIDPLSDSRWSDFVQGHPLATIFHSVAWLKALQRTYGYEPAVVTTSPPGDALADGLVFCRVSSWLTGRRYVSLPFSDHCDVLASATGDTNCLLGAWAGDLQKRHGKYAEIRTVYSLPGRVDFHKTQEFYLHKLDLRPPLEELFGNLHKSSIQRKIRRAEREGLTLEEGRSEAISDEFYRLFLMTRRRHHLPPPPRSWLSNLVDLLGPQLKIRVATKEGYAIASILTLRFKNTLFYKYGGSDPSFHALGGLQALFWKAIQEAKHEGLQCFDFGRSDLDDHGLITFKSHWGAECSKIAYFRYSLAPSHLDVRSWGVQTVRGVFAHMPDRVLSTAGKLLYKHVG